MIFKGIVLIYSQFIDGGIVPMALALEEMGFARMVVLNSQRICLRNHPQRL